MAINIQNKTIPPGLTEKTAEVFLAITKLDCIKELYLCGGTAQSIQMDHRLSEDLDFELLGIKKERPELNFGKIITEINNIFPDARPEILGNDHFHIFINEGTVKLSFFRPENPVKYIHQGYKLNNLTAPSLQDLLGMKLFTICVRSKTRDFYDIFCLLKQGTNLTEGISYASYLSRHSFKSKDILTKLITPQLYPFDEDFLKMTPRIQTTPNEMQSYFFETIKKESTLKQKIKTPKL